MAPELFKGADVDVEAGACQLGTLSCDYTITQYS